MVVIASGDTVKNRKEDVWKSLDAQREAIELLTNKPEEGAKLIASYFIAEPTLKTLKHGEVPREDIIRDAIKSQTLSHKLTTQEMDRKIGRANVCNPVTTEHLVR